MRRARTVISDVPVRLPTVAPDTDGLTAQERAMAHLTPEQLALLGLPPKGAA